MPISHLKLVVGDIHLAKTTSCSIVFFLIGERQKGDVSTCAKLRTFLGANCYVGSVVRRKCVIRATGFTLLKKLLGYLAGLQKMVWKVWLEKDISKQPPSSYSPVSPLALSSSGLMLILSENDGMQHYCRLLYSRA